MIIKQKNPKIYIFALTLLAFVSLISINKKTIFVEANNILENIMSLDLGFSYPRNIFSNELDSQHITTVGKIMKIISILPQSFAYKLSAPPELQDMEIIIKFVNYQKILADRSKALEKDFLIDPVFVKGKIYYQGKKFNADIRLKGDLGDHWTSSTRMSLRINLKNGETIMGMSKFTLQKPRARQYPYEHSFQNGLRELGNLGAIHNFVRVNVNGKKWGIMNLEENISKHFLEKENLKDSLVFRFSDDKAWTYFSDKNAYPLIRYKDPKLILTISKSSKYLSDMTNRKRYTYVLEQVLRSNFSSLIDVDSHFKALLASLVWNNPHTLNYTNSREYLNPYTLKLEPITLDQGTFSPLPIDLENALDDIGRVTNIYEQTILNLGKAEISSIDSFVRLFGEAVSSQLTKFDDIFPLDAPKSLAVMNKNINAIDDNLLNIKKWLTNFTINSISIKSLPKPSKAQAASLPEHIHVRHYDNGDLLVFNLIPENVTIEKIIYEGKKANNTKIIIPAYVDGNFDPLLIKTNLTGILDGKIKIVSSYNENYREIYTSPTLISEGVFNPLLKSTAEDFDFMKIDSQKSWRIPKGEWIVDKPLVIFGDLRIDAGTLLKFANDSYLIVHGAMSIDKGKNGPTIFEGLGNGWKGVYVLGKKNSISSIKNTVFENTNALSDGILNLTGGVNFYNGEVILNDITFNSSFAEDALNIVKATVKIKDIFIYDTFSDGFDCDYCNGSITDLFFEDIGGDGLDFSGSQIMLDKLIFRNIKDKSLSIGEATKVTVNNLNISDSGVGIAVKDNSEAIVNNCYIENYNLFAGMAYTKKNYYNPFSSLTFNNCTINGTRPFLSQENTFLMVDDLLISPEKIDVDKLYSTEVMKK